MSRLVLGLWVGLCAVWTANRCSQLLYMHSMKVIKSVLIVQLSDGKFRQVCVLESEINSFLRLIQMQSPDSKLPIFEHTIEGVGFETVLPIAEQSQKSSKSTLVDDSDNLLSNSCLAFCNPASE